MEFIKQLTDSRIYRRLDQIQGTNIATLSGLIFDHLIMLRVLYYIDKPKAVNYANDIMANQNFTSFRASMPDLYNLLVLVIQQKDFADKIFNDWDIVVPELRVKRVLRTLASGDIDNDDFDQLLMLLQRRFKKLTGDQMWMRRLVGDWKRRTRTDKHIVLTRLLQTVRRPTNSDLYMLLQTATRISPDPV